MSGLIVAITNLISPYVLFGTKKRAVLACFTDLGKDYVKVIQGGNK